MLYRTYVALGLVLVGGMAALVQAQQSSSTQVAPGTRALSSPRGPVRSILVGPTGSGASPHAAAASERSTLADRLQQIRDAATHRSPRESGSWDGAAGSTSRRQSNHEDLGEPPVPPPDEPELSPPTPPEDETPPMAPLIAPPVGGSSLESPPAPLDSTLITPRPRRSVGNSSAAAGGTAGVLLASQSPSLRVETLGPEAIVVGKEAQFVVRLLNEGSAPAEGVNVRLPLPTWVQIIKAQSRLGPAQIKDDGAGQQSVVWITDAIPAGGSEQLNLTLKPTDSRPFDWLVDLSLRRTSAVTQIAVQRPELAVALFGPKDVQYGRTGVFTVQLTNPGTGDAEDVVVEFMYGDRHLEPKPIGRLPAGQQTQIEVELSAFEAGVLRVSVAATAAGNLKAEATESLLVRRGQLEVEVQGPPMQFAGTATTYKVRVANTGNAPATNVMANVLLPRGAKPITTGDAVEKTEAGIAWKLGTVSPGAERVIEFSCELLAAGQNRVEATAVAADDLRVLSTFVTEVTALADLKLVVNDPQGPTPVGQLATYELRIVNRGTRAAEQVSVVAQFSEGIEPVEAHGCAANLVPGQVLFHPIPTVEPGAEQTLKIIARADRAGTHRFRAEVRYGGQDTRLAAEESTYFFDPQAVRTASRP